MTARRVHDVLAWDALVAPGVVLQKDGSLLTAWEVRGVDTGRLSLDMQQALRNELARGLSGLKEGETLWTVWQRRPWSPGPLLPNVGNEALDMMAMETNQIFAGEKMVWEDGFTLWLHAAQIDIRRRPLSEALDIFETRRRLLEGWLDPIVGLTRIDAQDPATPANTPRAEIICRLAELVGVPRPEPRLAEIPVALDALIAPDLHQPHTTGPITCAGRPLAVMTLLGERETYGPAPLEPLQNLALEFTWVTRYRALTRSEARSKLGWIRKVRKQSAADFAANIEGSSSGDRNPYADRLVAETEITREEIERGEEGHGEYLPVLTLSAPSQEQLTARVQNLREAVHETGFALRHEGLGAVSTWLAALPGHPMAVPREVMVRAQVMADCMPLRGFAATHVPSPLLPCDTPPLLPARTFAGTLHPFNLHVDDVGHTLVFGPTGTGKSVLLGHLIASWLRYPDAQVIAFDRGRSLRYATAALCGLWLEPGTPGTGAGTGVAPLAHIARLGPLWALDWVSEMVRRGLGHRPGPDETRELGMAIAHLAASPAPSLDRLRDLVQDKPIRTVLDSWITGPRAGTFGSADALDVGAALESSAITVFETEPLIDAEEDVTVLALDYIFAEVAARFDGRPTLIVIDEAWKLLAHDIFASRLRSWLKEGRRKNVALLMATQSVADAARAAITSDLVDGCPTRIYLANPMATTATQAPDYRAIGLTGDRIAAVAMLQRKTELMVVQNDCARVLGLLPGPVTLSILGKTASTESKSVAERQARNPEFWKQDLSGLGLPVE